MADVAESTGNDVPADETPNQRQARLRREKRQKKMAEEGEDRLARIKALNGGVAPPEEVLGGPGAQEQNLSDVGDPAEVDISQAGTDPQANPLAAAMLQMQQQQTANAQSKDALENAEQDPMVKMMEQVMGIMGGMKGDPQDPNAKPPDIPPALKALLAGGQAGQEDPPPPATGSAYLWRIVHVVFAFILASYIALTSTFNGSKLARSENVYTEEEGYGLGRRLFLIFVTAELLLQSSRYFAEKGQLQGNSMIAKIANSGFIPEPWAGYIRIFGRYITIAHTIFTDAMVIVFVFGLISWSQGFAAA